MSTFDYTETFLLNGENILLDVARSICTRKSTQITRWNLNSPEENKRYSFTKKSVFYP